MDTSEKQIIGENAKYVSDTIPQETKDGLRAHLKPGYAMPDGTYYATGMDYTELMRNLRNIQYCGCPLCHDTQSGVTFSPACGGGGFLLKNPSGFSIDRLSPHALWFARFMSRATR